MKCFLVDKSKESLMRGVSDRPVEALPAGDVLIDVEYSAVNYKDGLAAQGHPGVALELPLVPGIDAVGTVVESSADGIQTGDSVMVSGADFGTRQWGGWAEKVRVRGEYCIPVPSGLSTREAAIIGTAGFTAAQSLERLMHEGVEPSHGPVVVSGATGGVGVFAIKLLSQLGFHVVASTGKLDRGDWLQEHGATEVVPREELDDTSGRPLLSGKYAGGIDTVGGNPLSTLLRSTQPGGAVTACGLVAGHELPMTVYPFILRGVALLGIDSANASVDERHRIWKRLATDLKISDLESLVTEVTLDHLEGSVQAILDGRVAGRHLVRVAS